MFCGDSKGIIAHVVKNSSGMQFIIILKTPWRLKRLPALVVVLLSGCAMLGGTQQSCKVLDPDLAQGAYVGDCKDGLADGYGEVSGTGSYRGDFLAGKKHGKGIKVMPNGDRYAGGFSEDYRHGKGIYVWGPNTRWTGDRYEGEYRRDLRHGWGVFQWNSGDRYEGPWQDDLRMGLSVMETRRAQGLLPDREMLVGMRVCTYLPSGLNHHQRIRGTVESDAGQGRTIRITAMDATRASYRGKAIRVGDVVDAAGADWKLCGE